jgi:FkbM family methyltransferase
MNDLDQHETRALQRHISLLVKLSVQNPIIFDVGAHDGKSASAYLDLEPTARVIAFEPNLDLLAILQTLRQERLTVIPKAVGIGKSTANLKVRKDSRVSSLLDVDPQLGERSSHYDLVDSRTVDLIAIDAFIEEKKSPVPQLLRIGTKGSELSVLQSAEESLRGGGIMIVACEIYFGTAFIDQPKAHEVMGFLSDCGYRLYGFDRLVEASSGALYFGNALFLSTNAWRKLGIL